MPLDALFLTALADEMRPQLVGARIDKVQQPAKDMLLLSLYTKDGNRRLLISAGVGSARFHFTNERFENPDSPPMFCMLLRKHLVGGRISAITQPDNERLAIFELDTRDELGVESKKQLVVEMMGRSSNVILVDAEGRITDCLRRADFGEDAYRRLLPGMLYRLPQPPERRSIFDIPETELREMCCAAPEGIAADKWLMERFSGLSPMMARELSHRAGSERGNLPAAVLAFVENVAARDFSPVMLMEGDKARDFSFMPINQYGNGFSCVPYESFSELLEAFYSRRDNAERMRRISQELTKSVRTLHSRQLRKLEKQCAELHKTADREALRKNADLITANIWRIEKGDSVLRCEDFHTEGAPEVEIRLDPLKTPQQNSAALYKEYKKAAAAEKYLTALIAEGERTLHYLGSVLDTLSRVEGERDVAAIREELYSGGFLKQQRKRSKAAKKPKAGPGPMRFTSTSGAEILVGRSNSQNDELTFKTARRGDIWLHVQRLHGSHVILRTDGGAADNVSLGEAASLALYFSEGRESGKTPVDYTEVRHVKKQPGGLPGMVIYTDYNTIIAEPDNALLERLSAK